MTLVCKEWSAGKGTVSEGAEPSIASSGCRPAQSNHNRRSNQEKELSRHRFSGEESND